MKVVVFGGCGFIGSHVAEQLLWSGHDVTIFARQNVDRKNIDAIAGQIRFCGGDFQNAGDVRQAVGDAEVVLHLIGSTLPANSLENPVFDIQTNVVASVNLLSACIEAEVRKVVFVSSGGTVYGIPQTEVISEDHPLNPINPYGLSKLAVEKFLAIFSYQYGLDHTILRLSNPYGCRQRPGSGQGVVGAWMERIRRGEPIEMWGDGSTVRDYIPVGEAASAIVLAAESISCPKVMNVGSGCGSSLLEVLACIEACAGRPAKVLRRGTRKVDVPRNVLDVTRIGSALGWASITPLGEGIRSMWERR